MTLEEAKYLLYLKKEERKILARERLIDFTQYTFGNVSEPYLPDPVHYAICDAIERVIRGEIDRLMINIPPRHGKSELVTRRLPAFYIGKFPDRFIISATYNDALASTFGRDVRNIILSPEYQELFPHIRLASDQSAKSHWGIEGHRGSYLAAGVGTSITGRGAHLLSIDDPIKDRADAESEVIRKNITDWYTGVALTRLMPVSAVIVTQTRWHDEDLSGYLLNKELSDPLGKKWVKLIFPAIDSDGQALCPQRYPMPFLEAQRKEVGEYDWWSLYMQTPRPPGGAFFEEQDLLENGLAVDDPAICVHVFATMDTAVKTGKEHDGLATAYWAYDSRPGVNKYPLYLLDWDYRQLQGGSLEAYVPEVLARLNAFALSSRALLGSAGVWVEDKVSGTVLIQQMQNRNMQVNPIDTGLTAMGKSERAFNVSGYARKGLCKFTKRAYDRVMTFKGTPKNHMMSQILNFRIGTKETAADDCLDVFTYGLALSLGNYAGF